MTRTHDADEQSAVSAARPGRLTRNQLPASMGGVYPRAAAGKPWQWTGADCIVIDYATSDEAAAALLPSELSVLPAGRGGRAMARLWLATYRGGTLGPHNEAIVEIGCLYQGRFALYIPYAYVDSFPALASGREVAGVPQQFATIAVQAAGPQFRAQLDQHGRPLFSVRCTTGEPLTWLPLPRLSRPVLPPPFDQTLPLPEPDGQRHPIAIPVITTRYIPRGIDPQHILSDWAWETGTVYAAQAVIDHQDDTGPLATLAVLEILGALAFRGDMTVHGSTILQDMT